MKDEKRRSEMRGGERSFLMRLPIKLRSLMAEDCGALDVYSGRCRFPRGYGSWLWLPSNWWKFDTATKHNGRRTHAVIVE